MGKVALANRPAFIIVDLHPRMANYAEEIAVAIVIVTSSRRFTNISRLAPSNRLTRSLPRQFYVFSYISVTFGFQILRRIRVKSSVSLDIFQINGHS